MENIILKNDNLVKVIMKKYNDGSIKFVNYFKNSKRKEEYYLMADEVEIVRITIKSGRHGLKEK